MTEEQLIGIGKFVKRLRETLENSSLNKDPLSKVGIEYCLQVIDIHLEYAEIEREIEVEKEYKALGGTKNER